VSVLRADPRLQSANPLGLDQTRHAARSSCTAQAEAPSVRPTDVYSHVMTDELSAAMLRLVPPRH